MAFQNYSQVKCDGQHQKKQIGVLENKVSGECWKVFKCAACGHKWKEVL
jgi:hypothetical protein